MAFNNEIRVLNTSDTNHADNFNEPLQELLENTQFNAKQIGALKDNALQYKGHFNGDLNTLFGLDKVGIYALQHQCTNTPNDADNYVFERAILTVKSDGTSVTHDLIATHIGYATYVGKHYKRTGWVGADWQPWKCNDDEIMELQKQTPIEELAEDTDIFQYALNMKPSTKKTIQCLTDKGTPPSTIRTWWFIELQKHTNPTEAFVSLKATSFFGGLTYLGNIEANIFKGWKQISTSIEDTVTIKSDLGITPIFLTPKVVVTNGNTFTISGGLKLTKPVVEGTVVMALPNGIVPKFPYHIFFNSWNYDIPHSCRLWVDTDGNIKIYGASQFPTQEIDLDFSRSVTF